LGINYFELGRVLLRMHLEELLALPFLLVVLLAEEYWSKRRGLG
jgi:hypothetical protein